MPVGSATSVSTKKYQARHSHLRSLESHLQIFDSLINGLGLDSDQLPRECNTRDDSGGHQHIYRARLDDDRQEAVENAPKGR
jgi:hypothetical protein